MNDFLIHYAPFIVLIVAICTSFFAAIADSPFDLD